MEHLIHTICNTLHITHPYTGVQNTRRPYFASSRCSMSGEPTKRGDHGPRIDTYTAKNRQGDIRCVQLATKGTRRTRLPQIPQRPPSKGTRTGANKDRLPPQQADWGVLEQLHECKCRSPTRTPPPHYGKLGAAHVKPSNERATTKKFKATCSQLTLAPSPTTSTC